MSGSKTTDVRTLGPQDREQLEAFLEARPATTMFMRTNLRIADIASRPESRHEAAYAGAFSSGELVGAASQNWKGIVLVAGESGITEAAREVVSAAGLDIIGLSGPLEAVDRARDGLGLAERATSLDTPEHLYSLRLDELEVPELLHRKDVECRMPRSEEFELLCKWSLDYHLWLGGDENDAGAKGIPQRLRQKIRHGQCRVLEVDGEPVSYTGFNAALPGQVQVGGVWTPPEHRDHGYARSVVAGHLLDARGAGVERAILFTAEDNLPAQRAYEALGFERTGEYGLVFFEEPVPFDELKKVSNLRR